MIKNDTVFINGDGEASRHFCYIENTVQADILATMTQSGYSTNQVYNVAVGDRTTLNELFNAIKSALADSGVTYKQDPTYRDFRPGDVRHSQADVSKANSLLGHKPQFNISQGIDEAMAWYVKTLNG